MSLSGRNIEKEYEKQKEKLNLLGQELQIQKDEDVVQTKKTEAKRLEHILESIKSALPDLEQRRTALADSLQPKENKLASLERMFQQLNANSQASTSSTDIIAAYPFSCHQLCVSLKI